MNKDLCDERHDGINKKLDHLNKRLEKTELLYTTIHEMALNIQKLAIETKYMREELNQLSERSEEDIQAISNRVKQIEGRSGKKYDEVVRFITLAMVGAILTLLLANIGL